MNDLANQYSKHESFADGQQFLQYRSYVRNNSVNAILPICHRGKGSRKFSLFPFDPPQLFYQDQGESKLWFYFHNYRNSICFVRLVIILRLLAAIICPFKQKSYWFFDSLYQGLSCQFIRIYLWKAGICRQCWNLGNLFSVSNFPVDAEGQHWDWKCKFDKLALFHSFLRKLTKFFHFLINKIELFTPTFLHLTSFLHR